MATRTATPTAHIWLDENGRAWVDDTGYKVIEIALDKRADGLTPEETVEQHYHKLTLAQVHAALAYYYDHQAAFDAEMDRQASEAERLRQENLDSPIRQKLRAMGKIP
jgi:uncharacterized protein (DUF433 family)